MWIIALHLQVFIWLWFTLIKDIFSNGFQTLLGISKRQIMKPTFPRNPISCCAACLLLFSQFLRIIGQFFFWDAAVCSTWPLPLSSRTKKTRKSFCTFFSRPCLLVEGGGILGYCVPGEKFSPPKKRTISKFPPPKILLCGREKTSFQGQKKAFGMRKRRGRRLPPTGRRWMQMHENT